MANIPLPNSDNYFLSLQYLELLLVISSAIHLYVIYIFYKVGRWTSWQWPFFVLSGVFTSMLFVRLLRHAAMNDLIRDHVWLGVTTHLYLVDSIGLSIAGWAIYRGLREQTDRLLKGTAIKEAKELIAIAKQEAKDVIVTSKLEAKEVIAGAKEEAKEVIVIAAAEAKSIITDAASDAKQIVQSSTAAAADSKGAAKESREAATESKAAAEKSNEAAETLKQVAEEKK